MDSWACMEAKGLMSQQMMSPARETKQEEEKKTAGEQERKVFQNPKEERT